MQLNKVIKLNQTNSKQTEINSNAKTDADVSVLEFCIFERLLNTILAKVLKWLTLSLSLSLSHSLSLYIYIFSSPLSVSHCLCLSLYIERDKRRITVVWNTFEESHLRKPLRRMPGGRLNFCVYFLYSKNRHHTYKYILKIFSCCSWYSFSWFKKIL